MRKVFIGTSGWGYDEWVGQFYPKSLKKEDYLNYYSKVYYTNEINTTFYNTPNKWVVNNWVNKTPDDFFFTAKIPQSVTHKSKLDCDECLNDMDIYLDAMSPLIIAKKLKAFLIQLPPSFKKQEHFGNLKEFIDCWPGEREREGYFLVVEFRHKSWMDEEVFNYLKAELLSYCAVIEPLLPPRMDVTNPEFAYVRFHGYGKKPWFNYFFTEEEIKEWAIPMKEVIDKSKQVGIYFNNHFSGYATKNALMMMKELDLKPRKDPKEISILDIKKESGEYSKGQTSLDNFIK
jgi:uncharacterized protein YecE (DUF72 family)